MFIYRCLKEQQFQIDEYKIVPIRFEDRYKIMKWRNEQMYHLRQSTLLTKNEQDKYFENIVKNLFDQEKPEQILFSFLENDNCIGYGGLVHIDWEMKSGEISFLIATALEGDFFEKYWNLFLKMIEHVAFNVLYFHKIYTFAYDLRPKLYRCLDRAEFKLESAFERLNNRIIIHSKYSSRV